MFKFKPMSEATHNTVHFDKDCEFDESVPQYLFKTKSGFIVGTFVDDEYTESLEYPEDEYVGLKVEFHYPIGVEFIDSDWLLGYCEITEEV